MNKRASAPSWTLIGAVCFIILIVAVMAVESIGRQKDESIKLLTEKGSALIRSFEAGTRAGLAEVKWGRRHLQRLLTATVQQPDIEYILVSDINGNIIAHSDYSHIYGVHDFKESYLKDKRLNTRITVYPGNKKIFEVFREFKPLFTGRYARKHRQRMHSMLKECFNECTVPPKHRPPPQFQFDKNQINPENQSSKLMIFVGLDMSSIEKARKADVRRIISLGIIMFLTAFAGIALLYFIQSYKTAKSSLSRVKAATEQRIAAIGRLSAGVAHEIRNPLSSIKGFATYFKERYFDIPEDRQIADVMIQETERLNRVVGRLLDFTKPAAISDIPVSLEKIVRDALSVISQRASKQHIEIKTDFTQKKTTIKADKDRIKEVFLNLLLNSIEAMENGGVLSVSLKIENRNRLVSAVISDTGSGIKKEELENVFDTYFTTKSYGTGLGLAIVHNTIEAHGGKIEIKSGPGNWTAVTVFLPLV